MAPEIALQCREAVELLSDYLDDALTPEVRRRVDQHLKHCDACSAYLDQLRTTIDALGQLAPPPVSAAVRDDLLAMYREVRGR